MELPPNSPNQRPHRTTEPTGPTGHRPIHLPSPAHRAGTFAKHPRTRTNGPTIYRPVSTRTSPDFGVMTFPTTKLFLVVATPHPCNTRTKTRRSPAHRTLRANGPLNYLAQPIGLGRLQSIPHKDQRSDHLPSRPYTSQPGFRSHDVANHESPVSYTHLTLPTICSV